MGRTTSASSRSSSTPAPSARTRRAAAPAPRPRGASLAPRHHLSLPGAVTVPVPVLEDLAYGLEQTVTQQAIMCLYGDAGCGKTFGLDTVLASGSVPARRARLLRIQPRPAPTPAALRAHLADASNLDAPPQDPAVFDTALLRALAARDHLLVVDEAQRLDAACFEYLRYLFDDPGTRLAIVLAAGERGLAVLRRQKMLASRTAVWLKIRALTPTRCAGRSRASTRCGRPATRRPWTSWIRACATATSAAGPRPPTTRCASDAPRAALRTTRCWRTCSRPASCRTRTPGDWPHRDSRAGDADRQPGRRPGPRPHAIGASRWTPPPPKNLPPPPSHSPGSEPPPGCSAAPLSPPAPGGRHEQKGHFPAR